MSAATCHVFTILLMVIQVYTLPYLSITQLPH